MADYTLAEDVKEIASRLDDLTSRISGKTILMTGSRGFLGRYFMDVVAYLNEHVLDQPVKFIGLDNLITAGNYGEYRDATDHISFQQHDITQPFDFPGPIDYVVHAAGIASPFYYRAHPLETLDVSIIGTRNVLDMARLKKASFTFFSSSEIYGDPDPGHIPTPESYRGNVSFQGPRACYDESKRVGETLCYIYHNNHGLATNTIRPFNVYGPGMQETDYRVLPNFASCIKAKRQISVYGSGNQTRTFCYVTDAIAGFLRVILAGVPGEAYNIGTPDPEISMLDLVKRVEKVTGGSVDYRVIEHPDSYPADEPQRRCPDIRKARLQLGYEPVVDLDDGLGRFFRWADQHYTGVQ